MGYKYNDLNKMVDIFWQDHRTGKIEHYFSSSKEYKEDPEKFEKELRETEKKLVRMLSIKEKYSNNPLFKVSDSCSMINAEYKLSIIEEDGLPLFFKAYFINELETSPTPKKSVSPKQLFLYYDYEFFD